MILRLALCSCSIFFALKSIYFANLANINFGIVSCCYIVSIIVNSTSGYFFFQEKITFKMIGGMVVVVIGVIWISLARG